MRETIGAQKITLDNLLRLLSFYKETDKNMAALSQDLQLLKQNFDKVIITTVYKPSTYEIVDGVMVVKDNSSSTIEITDADIRAIRSTIENIRTKIIS